MAAGDGTVSEGSSNPLGMISSLLTLMNQGRGAASGTNTTTTQTVEGGGGTTSSSGYSSPGDTSALRALLGELGQADYTKLLESIFAQAGGKIPGFQAGLQNALGARSGSNSSVAAVLQKLLQDTVLQGQAQVVNAQLQNANIRSGLAQGIAQATKGTHTRQVSQQRQNPQVQRTSQVQTPLKQSYDMADALKGIALLSGAKGIFGELTKSDKQSGAGVPVIDAQPSWLRSATLDPTSAFSGNGLITSAAGTPSAYIGGGSVGQMNSIGSLPKYTFAPQQSLGFQDLGGLFGGDFGGDIGNYDMGSIGDWTFSSDNYNLASGFDFSNMGEGLKFPQFTSDNFTMGDYSLVPSGGIGGIGLQIPDDFTWF